MEIMSCGVDVNGIDRTEFSSARRHGKRGATRLRCAIIVVVPVAEATIRPAALVPRIGSVKDVVAHVPGNAVAGTRQYHARVAGQDSVVVQLARGGVPVVRAG